MHSISAHVFEGGNQVGIQFDRFPDECPICHSHVEPKLLTAVLPTFLSNSENGEAAFQCPKRTCRRLFLGRYVKSAASAQPPLFVLERVSPLTARTVSFPSEIEAVSPTFVAVYDQSMAAEAAELDQLTGIGLRKALEFLVKDFSIHQGPDKKEQIENSSLSNCINNYINDPNVKSTASRAAWLGNDETHYLRKWEGKDISDLKRLIKLTVNWIENVLLTKKYEDEMEAGRMS